MELFIQTYEEPEITKRRREDPGESLIAVENISIVDSRNGFIFAREEGSIYTEPNVFVVCINAIISYVLEVVYISTKRFSCIKATAGPPERAVRTDKITLQPMLSFEAGG